MDEKLKVIITATISDFKNKTNEAKKELQSLSEEGEKSSSKLKSAMSKVGTATKKVMAASAKVVAAGVGIAAAGITAIVKSAVQNYAEYEQLIGGVETMFKKNADIVQKYASEAYKTAGISANQYMTQVTSFSASLLQSLGGDTKKAADYANTAVLDMSDNANKFGTDIQSIQDAYQGFAKQNYTMLDNLKLGYGGTKSEMERLIADANKVKKANGEMADLSIDSFADVVEAIHTMQEEMGITGTTAKEASETISGSLMMTKAAWSNLLTGIADDNADFQQLIDNFVESASIAFENILPRITTALQGVAKLIDAVFPVIMKKIPEIINSVLPSLASAAVNIVTSFYQGIISGMPQITSALTSIVSVILNALPQLINSGIQMVAALSTGIAQSIPQIVSKVTTIIPQIVNGLTTSIPALISGAVQLFMAIVQAIVNGLVANIPVLIAGAIQLLLAMIQAIPIVIQALVDAIPMIVEGIVSALVANIPILIAGAIQLFWGIIKAIPNIIVALASEIPKIIAAIVKGLIAGVGQILSAAGNMFKGVITKAKEAKDKALEKFNELKDKTSEKFDEIKTAASEKWEGVKTAVSKAAGFAKDSVTKEWDFIKNTTSTVFNGIKSVTSTVWSGIKTAVSTSVNSVKTLVTSVWNSIKSATSNVFNGIKSVTTSVWNGIKSAITKPVEAAKNAVKTAINKMKSFFKFKWELPKLKLPHISISGKFSLAPPSVPKFSISWHKLGGIFDAPTLFGYGGGVHGLGEDGAEAIVPLEKNTQWLDKIADRLTSRQGNTPIILQVDGKTFAQTSVESINALTRQTGKLGLNIV